MVLTKQLTLSLLFLVGEAHAFVVIPENGEKWQVDRRAIIAKSVAIQPCSFGGDTLVQEHSREWTWNKANYKQLEVISNSL